MWMERMVLRLVQDVALRQVQNGVLLFARDAALREQAGQSFRFWFLFFITRVIFEFLQEILEHVQTFFTFPGGLRQWAFTTGRRCRTISLHIALGDDTGFIHHFLADQDRYM